MERHDCIQALFPLGETFQKGKSSTTRLIVDVGKRGTTEYTRNQVHQDFFHHALLFLSNLGCFSEEPVKQNHHGGSEWNTYAVYGINSTDLVPPPPSTSTAFIRCSDLGDSDGIMSREVLHRQTIRATDMELHCRVEQLQVLPKTYLRPMASFRSPVVERTRSFTYTSHYTWTYTMTVRWSHPSIPSEMIGGKEDIFPLTFARPPTHHMSIECQHRSDDTRHDLRYLLDSMLCKIHDILPTHLRIPRPFVVEVGKDQLKERTIDLPPSASDGVAMVGSGTVAADTAETTSEVDDGTFFDEEEEEEEDDDDWMEEEEAAF